MSGVHILDILAARRGCFISDLNLSPILRRAALFDLAMANTSARWARAICSTSQGVSRRNISVTTGCLESVSRVRGVRNSWAWRVMMQ